MLKSADGLDWRVWLENIFSRADLGQRLRGLDVRVSRRFRLLILGLADRGYSGVRITDGLRELDTERRLYGYGRTVAECHKANVAGSCANPLASKVTWCTPERSKHVRGLAIDVSWRECELPPGTEVAELCKELGITWGGNWKQRDDCHFEL
jgi:hypothetical protein